MAPECRQRTAGKYLAWLLASGQATSKRCGPTCSDVLIGNFGCSPGPTAYLGTRHKLFEVPVGKRGEGVPPLVMPFCNASFLTFCLEMLHDLVLQLLHSVIGPIVMIEANETLPLRSDLRLQFVTFTVALPIVLNLLKCHFHVFIFLQIG